MDNLKAVLQNLKSDKFKERQEGLASIRTVFEQDKVVANFHINREGRSDPRAWLSIFQALFGAVLNEKLASTKKATTRSAGPSAIALRRLEEAASVVRWLIERSVHLLNNRVVKALLEHLIQTMIHRGELLAPVVLDYVKALKCLASYTPHLEHMEDDTWVRIVELGFNVILGDPVKSSLQDTPSNLTSPDVNDVDDSEFYEEDTVEKDSGDESPTLSKGKRRRRLDDETPPLKTFKKQKSDVMSKSRRNAHMSVSVEQIEFASLLSILLGSSAAPLLSVDHAYLPSAVLARLLRFLESYPADSSLLHDYLVTLSHALQHLSLNRKHEVQMFARSSWDTLVSIWGSKDKRLKGDLVIVLRTLFPFVTSDIETGTSSGEPFDYTEGVWKLWHILSSEVDSKWGIDALSLDAIRLESRDLNKLPRLSDEVFATKTFRAGWNFDADQASVWAILELQADCAGKLFKISESIHISSVASPRWETRRTKPKNPVTTLLHKIQTIFSTHVRTYYLQTLLFFVDKHWSILHDSLRIQIVQALLQLVSVDDGLVQSWVFLNLAAVAYAETHPVSPVSEKSPSENTVRSVIDVNTWDSIWTHAIRRVNVPAVCRAACHAALALIDSSLRLPATPRVLLEIESLGKDMDVQGPAYPYDSVCLFLVQCLKIASQDVRLYRMQLEEKVLSWLVDSWKIVSTEKGKMASHTVNDVLSLLEGICSLGIRHTLLSDIILPHCQIVDLVKEDTRSKVIRDFLLDGELPPFRHPMKNQMSVDQGSDPLKSKPLGSELHLVQPRARERKVSAFLLKSLDALLERWELSEAHPSRATAEWSRRSLDFSVTALAFESTLTANGIVANRRVLQSAVKLMTLIVPLLKDHRWSQAEKSFVSLALKPLVIYDNSYEECSRWETMLPPEQGSGIRRQVFKDLISDESHHENPRTKGRMNILRTIWQNVDVRNVFTEIMGVLRDILSFTAGMSTNDHHSQHTMDVDDRDGFGPIRTNTTHPSTETHQIEDKASLHHILDVSLQFVIVGPLLQSASGEPTRDKELVELVLGCAGPYPEFFFMICPIFLDSVRQKHLNITVKHLDSFLDELSKLLQSYAYARSERLQLLAIQLLDSTLNLWSAPQVSSSDIGDKVKELCMWLSGALRKRKIRSWATRDTLACFFNKYLHFDEEELLWSTADDEESQEEASERKENFPTYLLPMMNADEDIRVRFRVAVLNARLFSSARAAGDGALVLYGTTKNFYTTQISNYEMMLTRMLALGNIMVTSSAVRRGPYWHLLETCVHSNAYSKHIESILNGVSQRLGLKSCSELFQAYASQLAYSIRQSEADFLRFPPHLLGYKDRKQCAEASFRSFTPTNILSGAYKIFENHCKVLQKPVEVGLRECFGDIVGIKIVTWFDSQGDSSGEQLEVALKSVTFDSEIFEESLEQNLDGIISSMLRTLDHWSPDNSIHSTLQRLGRSGKSAQTFQDLTRFCDSEQFHTHKPNLPAFPAGSILRGIFWLGERLSGQISKATTYHVVHELLADVQRSPLINEQIRLVHSISLWISCFSQHFDDGTLLYMLVHGATSLLEQSDLARNAQSILEWAFRRYRTNDTRDPRLSNILIRIGCLAHDFASSRSDITLHSMGIDLLKWIDKQVIAFRSTSNSFDNIILRALPAWPHQPSEELIATYNNISPETISAVLADNRITSNKFKLVRRLRDQAASDGYDELKFSKTDFWRLKESVPHTDQLQDDDISAFAALLFITHGRIISLGVDQPVADSIRTRHRRSHRKIGNTPGDHLMTARETITIGLLMMLEEDIATHVFSAYNTLRLILSVWTPDMSQMKKWIPEFRVQVQYLQSYRRAPKSRPVQNLRELLESEPYMESTRDFSVWISTIANLFSDALSVEDPIFAQLTDILNSDTDFAEQLLPILVHTLLQSEKQKATTADKQSLCAILSKYFTSILLSDHTSTSCLRAIVDVVLHLRHFPPSSPDVLACNKWLNIDFGLLARKAILYGAYTTALLFLELSSEDNPRHEDSSHEQVLYEIYAHIDEPDGFYGIKTKNLHQFLIKRFHHEKQWEKAFRFHGAAMEAGRDLAGDTEGLLKSFHSFGFNHLAIDTLQTSEGHKESLSNPSSMNYRLGWRTETWDLPDPEGYAPGASLYQSLRANYRERDPLVVKNVIRHSIRQEMSRLKTLGSENVAEIREITQTLMCLSQILQWRQDSFQNLLATRSTDEKCWTDFFRINSGFEFSDLESIMATRIALVRSVRHQEERQQIGSLTTPFSLTLLNVEQKLLLRLSEAAREADQVQIALNSVVRAQRLEQGPSFSVSREFANVLWLEKEEELAVRFLHTLAEETEPTTNDKSNNTRKASLLARLGAWTSEACLEKPAIIWARYFEPSIEVLGKNSIESSDDAASHGMIYHECAMFAERQYYAILRSPDAIRLRVYVDRKKQEIHQRSMRLADPQSTVLDATKLRHDQENAQKLLQEDSELFRKHNAARDTFLHQAIEMYSRCLETSNAFDTDAAIRFCSLWFANFDKEAAFQDTVCNGLNRIPSSKLVFLAHQLTARLSKSPLQQMPKNQENLQNLVIQMCREHPFHSLYQVYCLLPNRYSTIPKKHPARQPTQSSQSDRGIAAIEIFDRLKSEGDGGKRAVDVERLCDACLQWAKHPITNDKRYVSVRGKDNRFDVPPDLLIRRISNIRVPVPTFHTPLDLTMRYDDCVWINHYDSKFETAGGINLPKISVCYGSDGKKYKQLFKGEGNDDLRQDAVMEQVFDLVNSVLGRDRETRRRELRVRDYKVIPLDTQAGLLEFVGNTSPMRDWLTKAHSTYRPSDIKTEIAFKKLKSVQLGYPNDTARQLENFLELRESFKPVMRHYFTEKHKTPISWFSMRLNYARSVATTSIVGHVLGLGDRHTSNILMDNVSGEVIHIDLGIAFDQGKLLKVPERVPFRMTADIVDGMGISGTQGVFQRCAEETLRVLREGSEVIMTVLEVFKHDPLHSWTASEIKVKQAQHEVPSGATINDTIYLPTGIGIDMSSGTAEEAADRALSSVARKLDKSLSVEYTINELIAEATDPLNLATIFYGWGPHL